MLLADHSTSCGMFYVGQCAYDMDGRYVGC